MTTSLTTFETNIREALLDVVYAQWQQLGIPFSTPWQASPSEIIDPEALLWCSLEFFPTDARLREGVSSWLASYKPIIAQRRLKHVANASDARKERWETLCDSISPKGLTRKTGGSLSPLAKSPATALLRTRYLFGNDARHILLVYLLTHPQGTSLRNIESYAKYSYRSLSETASQLQAAKVLTIDRGFCRLLDARPWYDLLGKGLQKASLIGWFDVFEGLIELLRGLANAREKQISPQSGIIDYLCHSSLYVLFGDGSQQGPHSLTHLLQIIEKGRIAMRDPRIGA